MKLFKSIDEQLSDIGFHELDTNKVGASYERQLNKWSTQRVDLIYKENNCHSIKSYVIYNTSTGENKLDSPQELSIQEMKLFLKKMKELGLK